ncbi:hypothetical protein [Streptomyces marincola]|uniref:Uncharacterized protein n=1 Tax=Streptomyces marincola TaxID=2878388 RepID=A0A1W7D4C1_9ACTN|nr:hypothetical protein [Streptomyces marincola]ARQ71844.1 hypothetical protein CAG99_26125 [Streptomyces marincola]
MPVNIPAAPTGAEECVRSAIGPATTRVPRPPYLDHGDLDLDLPLPVHRLGPVAGTLTPPSARLTGWRFLLTREGRTVGAAEAAPTADGWAFSHFCEGPYIASTERTVRLAESLPETYQPRLLSVPELYMLTLWLHSDSAAEPGEGSPLPQDLLVPLTPAPPGIAAGRAVRTDVLLPLLSTRLAPPVGLAS